MPRIPQVKISNAKAYNNLLEVRVGGNHIWALVDSGASISVISKETAALLQNSMVATYRPDFTYVSGVGGDAIPVKEKVLVDLQVNHKQFRVFFHVIPSTNAMILGMDFLTNFNVRVDFAISTVIIENMPVKLCRPAIKSCIARTLMDYDFPPQTETVCPVRCSTKYLNNDIVLRSAKIDSLTVQVSDTLVNVSGNQTWVRVINTSDDVVRIPAKTVIAYGTQVPKTDIRPVDTPHPETQTGHQTSLTDNDLDFNIDNPSISHDDEQALLKFLKNHRHVFAKTKAELTRSTLVEHEIVTGDAKPVLQRFYRTSPLKRDEIDRQVEELLQFGLIRPSSSEWTSPVVLVKKPDGSWRMCCDYRKLNAVTKPQSYPLPRLEDVWDAIGEHDTRFLSVIDMSNGFWQLAMNPNSIEKTSFVTQNGQYEWNCLPYGLSNSPVTFMRTVHQALRGLVFKCCVIYVDDVICYSSNMDDHLKHLGLIFARLKEAGLKLNPRKCQFAAREVKYLGHILSPQGVRPNPEKTAIVDTFPAPKNVKEVRSFLGLTNYYRRFIRDYSKLAAPMYGLLRQEVTFDWTSKCQTAFEDLKSKLVSPPIIGYPNMKRHFYLTTDACGTGIGYVLTQRDDDNKEVVIAYGGRALRDNETRFSASELEMLAAKEGITHYRPYLEDKMFTLITDHQPLTAIHKFKASNKRLGDMALFLQGYNFKAVYKPGKANTNADALSRRPYDTTTTNEIDTSTEETTSPSLSTTPTVGDASYQALLTDPIDGAICNVEPCEMAEEQRLCTELGELYVYHLDGTLPLDPEKANLLHQTADHYVVSDDVLYHVYFPTNRRRPEHMIKQLVVPFSRRKDLLIKYHNSLVGGGHQGLDRTYSALILKYFWPKMYTEVQRFISSCDICQRTKKRHTRPPPLTPLPVVPPFHRWHVDFLKLAATPEGYQYLLLFVDAGSKWCEAIPTKKQTAETVAKCLYQEIITRYGAPVELVSDQGRQFKSKLVKAMAELYDIKLNYTSPYHPQTNAACERMNSFIVKTIRAYCKPDQSDWPDLIPAVMMAYRSMPATRSHQLAPFQVLFGNTMSVPGDLDLLPKPTLPETYQQLLQQHLQEIKICREVAQENLMLSQEINRSEHDRNKHAQAPTFKVGEQVLLRNQAVPVGLVPKLHPPYKGPYWITRLGPNYTYHLEDVNGKTLSGVINGRRLIPYLDRLTPETEPASNETAAEMPPPTQPNPPSLLSKQNELITKLRQTLLKECASTGDVRENTPSTSITQPVDAKDTQTLDNTLTKVPSKVTPPTASEKNTAPRVADSSPSSTEDQPAEAPIGKRDAAPGVADSTPTLSKNQETNPSTDQPIDIDRLDRSVVEVIKMSYTKSPTGRKYCKVKMLNQKYQPWIYEEDVPKEALERFLATKTLSGKKRKRKPLKYFQSNKPS